jgi:ABC-type glutathione transport system ATPase component
VVDHRSPLIFLADLFFSSSSDFPSASGITHRTQHATFALSVVLAWLNIVIAKTTTALSADMVPILEVQDLHVVYASSAGNRVPALGGVTFSLNPGEILGVLGESGSGKSTLGGSLLRLLPLNGVISRGELRFEGTDVLSLDPGQMQDLRGRRLSLVFQEPSMALHPTIRVEDQVSEVLAAHGVQSRTAKRERTRATLESVFPSDVERIARAYPHQLSGGQRQRVLIAQAIACRPALIVADEPTASLDPVTQCEILALLRSLRDHLGLSLILITHNPALLADFADRVLVLHAGNVVEIGPVDSILLSPQHPYTRALLKCLPPVSSGGHTKNKSPLPVIATALSSAP